MKPGRAGQAAPLRRRREPLVIVEELGTAVGADLRGWYQAKVKEIAKRSIQAIERGELVGATSSEENQETRARREAPDSPWSRRRSSRGRWCL